MKPPILKSIQCIALLLGVSLADITTTSANSIEGHVMGGGMPIAGADVILWAAGPGAPARLVETQTDADGRFDLMIDGNREDVGVLHHIATGGKAIGGAARGQTLRSV